MSSGNDDYQATLNKMADLQDLVATVETTSKALTSNKQKLIGSYRWIRNKTSSSTSREILIKLKDKVLKQKAQVKRIN